MFTASGLIVRFLKVFEKSDYTAVKWVRYLTKASGTYQIRVSLEHTVLGSYLTVMLSSEWSLGRWPTYVHEVRLSLDVLS
jgi:hypothetical protein